MWTGHANGLSDPVSVPNWASPKCSSGLQIYCGTDNLMLGQRENQLKNTAGKYLRYITSRKVINVTSRHVPKLCWITETGIPLRFVLTLPSRFIRSLNIFQEESFV